MRLSFKAQGMTGQILYTTKQWESAKPASVVYDHIFYSEAHPGKVMVVHGFVRVVKRIPLADGKSHRKSCYRKAIWNADGHCRIGRFHIREQKYDIPLNG